MRPGRKRSSGFTLLEIAVAMGVLGVVLGAVGAFQTRSNEASRSLLRRADAESRARRALERVADELAAVGQSLLFPDPTTALGASSLTYQRPSGVDASGVVQWTPPSRLQLELEAGEADDGLDNDRDELVDERRLVLLRSCGTSHEQRVVLCSGLCERGLGELPNGIDDDGDGTVDEAGFSVRRIGDLLLLSVCVQPAGRGGRPVEFATAVVLRN